MICSCMSRIDEIPLIQIDFSFIWSYTTLALTLSIRIIIKFYLLHRHRFCPIFRSLDCRSHQGWIHLLSSSMHSAYDDLGHCRSFMTKSFHFQNFSFRWCNKRTLTASIITFYLLHPLSFVSNIQMVCFFCPSRPHLREWSQFATTKLMKRLNNALVMNSITS